MAVGAASFALVAVVSAPVTLLAVTILAFGTGWGWPALFNYAIVSRTPSAPGLATGIAGTGLYTGGIVGPPLFGAVVEASGYTAAWLCVAASAACSSVLMHVGGRWLERSQQREVTSATEYRGA